MEFKGTKGKWDVFEHSWSDTSILCGDKTICTQSIFDEATEENQDELETEVQYNFQLISKAPELLEYIIDLYNDIKEGALPNENEIEALEKLIKEATEI